MSPEKIIELAKQADWPDSLIAPVIMQKLNDFAKLVAQHECEACIDIVAMFGGSIEIEAAIRARSK